MTSAMKLVDESQFFSEEQRKIIRDSFLGGANDAEAAMLLEIARALRLNPLKKEIYFVKRPQWDKQLQGWKDVWAAQTGIDGFRTVAERTGQYDGQDEPEFEERTDGSLKLCKVRVWRRGISRPFVGVAYWDEFVQFQKDQKTPVAMWGRGRHFMLAKCAEAQAIRKAFPGDIGGLTIPEETAKEDAERDISADVVEVKRGLSAIPSLPQLPAATQVVESIPAKAPEPVPVAAPALPEAKREAKAEKQQPLPPNTDPVLAMRFSALWARAKKAGHKASEFDEFRFRVLGEKKPSSALTSDEVGMLEAAWAAETAK